MDINLQAHAIETTLAAHGINSRVWQAMLSPRYVRYSLTVPLGQRVADVLRLHEELALALRVPTLWITRDGGLLVIDVPRDDPLPVDLGAILAKLSGVGGRRPTNTAILGVGADGLPLLLNLSGNDTAHALISGITGSGKTELLRTIAASLAKLNPAGRLRFALVDGANRLAGYVPSLMMWRGLAAATTADAAGCLLRAAAAEIDNPARGYRLVVLIDELADLLQAAPDLEAPLLRLTQRGRQVGINVIAATQRPSAAAMSTGIKANLATRFVGAVASPEDAKIASGIAGTGAERLRGNGDFLLVATGHVIRFQAARCRSRHEVSALPGWEPEPVTQPLLSAPAAAREDESAAAVTNRLPWRTPDEAGRQWIRKIYADTGSLNAVCRICYGGKNDRVLVWVKEAIWANTSAC